MVLFLLFAALVLVLSFYIYFTWTFDYWKRRNVPFEPPTVFVGNMTFALRENMAIYIQRLYRKFEGYNYFGIWILRKPIFVIRSPEMAKEVLVTKFNYFIDRAMETDESDKLGAKCLFLARGEYWTRLRQRLSPAFTKAKIRNIMSTRIPTIVNELQVLIDKEHTSKPIEIKDLFLKYVVEVIAGTIFGIRANSMQDKNSQFLKIGLSFVNLTPFRGVELMSIFFFPELVKMFKFKVFTQESNDIMRALFVKILESREAAKNDPSTQSLDIMDALLKLKDSSSGNDFTDDDIIAQAGLFLFAGLESTSTTMSFMCYELAFNQEYQESLYQQIKSLKADKAVLDLDDLDDCRLLDMGIKETIRKYPIIPFTERLCGKECKLSDGHVVEKGMRVLICTSGLHNDEKYFPEPDRWNPYRFENENKMVPYTFMPFSEGQRTCIGAKFGMLSMKITLSSLIERYRFEPSADTTLPKDMRMSPYTLFSASDGPIMLNIIRR